MRAGVRSVQQALRVKGISEQRLLAVSNGYRIKHHIGTEYDPVQAMPGASSAIFGELILANMWLIANAHAAASL